MSEPSGVAAQVAEARRDGNRDEVARLLVLRADELVRAGELLPAREAMDEAAGIHEAAGRAVDHGRCLVFAATLSRGLGKLRDAEERARRALEVSPAETVPRVSAHTELGEIASMQKHFGKAEEHYRVALEEGIATGLIAFHQAALLRKRAQALALAGRAGEAAPLLERARECYAEAGDAGERRRTGVELLTARAATGQGEEAAALAGELEAEAQPAGDHTVLADLALWAAGGAIDEGRIDEAIAELERARQHALDGVAPVQYLSAQLALSELHESRDDRVAAYEALAVGWATLGDLLGEDAAKSTFEPRLLAQRQRWGDVAFIAARDAYYERRKRELGRS